MYIRTTKITREMLEAGRDAFVQTFLDYTHSDGPGDYREDQTRMLKAVFAAMVVAAEASGKKSE